MKALQKNKQTVQRNEINKPGKPVKISSSKKSSEADVVGGMIFSEYDVWPVLAELHNRKN